MAQQLPLMDTPTDTPPSASSTQDRRPVGSPRSGGPGRRSRDARHTGPTATRIAGGRAFAVVLGRPGSLLEIPAADWLIDSHTKEVGLAGVAAARRALADAVRRTAA